MDVKPSGSQDSWDSAFQYEKSSFHIPYTRVQIIRNQELLTHLLYKGVP